MLAAGFIDDDGDNLVFVEEDGFLLDGLEGGLVGHLGYSSGSGLLTKAVGDDEFGFGFEDDGADAAEGDKSAAAGAGLFADDGLDFVAFGGHFGGVFLVLFFVSVAFDLDGFV